MQVLVVNWYQGCRGAGQNAGYPGSQMTGTGFHQDSIFFFILPFPPEPPASV